MNSSSDLYLLEQLLVQIDEEIISWNVLWHHTKQVQVRFLVHNWKLVRPIAYNFATNLRISQEFILPKQD